MEKFKQSQLLNEGFWAGFKSGVKGFNRGFNRKPPAGGKSGLAHKLGAGARMFTKAVEYAAPEIANPVKKGISATKDILGIEDPNKRRGGRTAQNSASNIVTFRGTRYLLDLSQGTTPTTGNKFKVQARQLTSQGAQGSQVTLEMDRNFKVYSIS